VTFNSKREVAMRFNARQGYEYILKLQNPTINLIGLLQPSARYHAQFLEGRADHVA
jgi:hypothetical protein